MARVGLKRKGLTSKQNFIYALYCGKSDIEVVVRNGNMYIDGKVLTVHQDFDVAFNFLEQQTGVFDERERMIFRLYFLENKTFKEIANIYGVTATRATQIMDTALLKVWNYNFGRYFINGYYATVQEIERHNYRLKQMSLNPSIVRLEELNLHSFALKRLKQKGINTVGDIYNNIPLIKGMPRGVITELREKLALIGVSL